MAASASARGGLGSDAAGGTGREGAADHAEGETAAHRPARESAAEEPGVEAVAGADRVDDVDDGGVDMHEAAAVVCQGAGGAELDHREGAARGEDRGRHGGVGRPGDAGGLGGVDEQDVDHRQQLGQPALPALGRVPVEVEGGRRAGGVRRLEEAAQTRREARLQVERRRVHVARAPSRARRGPPTPPARRACLST